MKNLLLSERWRPKKIDDLILLPRIKKLFENGIQQNVIFYGHFGTGKTSIARILIGKYTKDKPFLELNSSFYTSIDVLRSKVDDFCSKVYMGIDLLNDHDQDQIKYVFLDEFDRTSIQYQDALKAYIEEFSRKNVRFILTTNHINKISQGIRSRLVEINFDCQNSEEEKYCKTEIYKKIVNEIAPSEGFNIPKETLIKIINRRFPDFRSIIIDVDQYRITGEDLQSSNSINQKLKIELYNLCYAQKLEFDEIYNFIVEKFGNDNIDQMIDLLGVDFINHTINEKKENTFKLFNVAYIICEHKKLLETSTDPLIIGLSVIGKIRDLLIN